MSFVTISFAILIPAPQSRCPPRWSQRDGTASRVCAASGGPPEHYPGGRHPVMDLVDRLAQRADRSLIAVERPGLKLRLERGG